MKLAVLVAILTVFVSLSGPDDPGLTAARKARNQGDVKTLQVEITKTEKKAAETKSFEDYLRLALLHNYMCEAAESSNNRGMINEARRLNPGRKFAEFVFEQLSANKKAGKSLGGTSPTMREGS